MPRRAKARARLKGASYCRARAQRADHVKVGDASVRRVRTRREPGAEGVQIVEAVVGGEERVDRSGGVGDGGERGGRGGDGRRRASTHWPRRVRCSPPWLSSGRHMRVTNHITTSFLIRQVYRVKIVQLISSRERGEGRGCEAHRLVWEEARVD